MSAEADRCRNELLTTLRDQILSGEELVHYACGIYGDANAFSLYSVPCTQFSQHGIRIPGRTLIESTTDSLADASAAYVREVISSNYANGTDDVVALIDPFLGSGNILLHLQRKLSSMMVANHASAIIGIELDDVVAQTTADNLQALNIPIDVKRGDYVSVLSAEECRSAMAQLPSGLCVVFLAPPWGTAFSFEHGLDLRKTEPSSFDAMRFFTQWLQECCSDRVRPLYVIQIHERMEEASVQALAQEMEIVGRTVFAVSKEGTNVGCLVCRPFA